MRLSSTAFYRGMPWLSTMAPLLPKFHLIPVSTTTTPNKIGDQLSTVTLISPGKKPASSTVFLSPPPREEHSFSEPPPREDWVFLSELLNFMYFLFFPIIYHILVHFFFTELNKQTPLRPNSRPNPQHLPTLQRERGPLPPDHSCQLSGSS